ncbi:hypothetical protein SAY86_023939 [Trapa natans]|uniref:Uncharacterized protein n=1 Tax=Trapa natans TaxID=22666 RepID=A0AAN7R681_TRANT|nr:hypothetical protein SAY86_023939 [Trapa natans]
MGTAPEKSQPLHNFSLPSVQGWGGGGSSNGHYQRLRRSAPTGEPPVAESGSDRNDSDPDSRHPRAGSRQSHRFLSVSTSSVDLEKPHVQSPDVKEKNPTIAEKDDKLHAKNVENNREGADEAGTEPHGTEATQRPWNLRPRKVNQSPKLRELRGATAAASHAPSENQQAKTMRQRGFADTPPAAGGESKEKRRLWVALSKDEIEADILLMTGSKPARRPKKWPKDVQKYLDNTYPGTSLEGSAADDFQLNDPEVSEGIPLLSFMLSLLSVFT